jgi:hypothetical protein
MKKQTTGVLADASAKTTSATAKPDMPLPLEVILETRAEIKALSAQAGLRSWHASWTKRLPICPAPRVTSAPIGTAASEAMSSMADARWASPSPARAPKRQRDGPAKLPALSGERSDAKSRRTPIAAPGLHGNLARSFSSTNLIASCFARTEAWTRRVKRWRDPKMILRWGAAALLVAEQGFRRIRGCAEIQQLLSALSDHQAKLAQRKAVESL